MRDLESRSFFRAGPLLLATKRSRSALSAMLHGFIDLSRGLPVEPLFVDFPKPGRPAANKRRSRASSMTSSSPSESKGRSALQAGAGHRIPSAGDPRSRANERSNNAFPFGSWAGQGGLLKTCEGLFRGERSSIVMRSVERLFTIVQKIQNGVSQTPDCLFLPRRG